MELEVYFDRDNGTHYNPSPIYEDVYDRLVKEYPEIVFNYHDTAKLRTIQNYEGPSSLIGPLHMRILNKNNGKFILISYWDIAKNLLDKSNLPESDTLVQFLTSIGITSDENFSYQVCDLPIKYTPISMSLQKSIDDELIEQAYKKHTNKIIREKPLFRGTCYGFRKHLMSDSRFQVFDIASQEYRLEKEEYLDEVACSQINVSFNGMGESCLRDIEILGLGCTLLRPKLSVRFRTELIPDYHYASVEVSDQGDFETLAEAFHQKYQWLCKNQEVAKAIANNGRKWYLENGTTPKNAEIIFKSIKLEKLWNQ